MIMKNQKKKRFIIIIIKKNTKTIALKINEKHTCRFFNLIIEDKRQVAVKFEIIQNVRN